jgi:hypothetical protein
MEGKKQGRDCREKSRQKGVEGRKGKRKGLKEGKMAGRD